MFRERGKKHINRPSAPDGRKFMELVVRMCVCVCLSIFLPEGWTTGGPVWIWDDFLPDLIFLRKK